MKNEKFAEIAVCGSILIDAACLPAIRAVVTEQEFSTAQGKALFRAACALADAGKIVDPVTITDEAREQGRELPADLLLQFMEATPTAANAREYAEVMVRESLRRRATSTAKKLGEESITRETLDAAIASLQALRQEDARTIVNSSHMMEDLLVRLEALENGQIDPALPTGILPLDRLLGGGMTPQGLYILGARPGVGKTTLGLTIASHCALQGPVLFVSLEMPQSQLAVRLAAQESGIPMQKLFSGEGLTQQDWDKLAVSSSRIAQRQLYLCDNAAATIGDLERKARAIPGLKLLVVDYLGLLKGEGRTRYDQTTWISNRLKGLAKQLNIPVLCLCQLNRAVELRPGGKPTMADLRDSGSIEQDADAVLLLHQPGQSGETETRPEDPALLELYLVKNRHGRLGRFQMDFYGVNNRIRPS